MSTNIARGKREQHKWRVYALFQNFLEYLKSLFEPIASAEMAHDGFVYLIDTPKHSFANLIYRNGAFGKATLSRGLPTWFNRHYHNEKPSGFSEQRLLHRFESLSCSWIADEIDRERYILSYHETLHLMFQNRLRVYQKEETSKLINLTRSDVWTVALQIDPDFATKHSAYTYFINIGWKVKPGLIYGCDFTLYKKLARHTHSEYCVWVLRFDQKVDVKTLAAKSRVCNSVQKKLMICYVKEPGVSWDEIDQRLDHGVESDSDACILEDVSQYQFKCVVLGRWLPEAHR